MAPPGQTEEPCERSGPINPDREERLQEERVSLLAQLDLLEKRKNEEIQNMKTSLIAEQQVRRSLGLKKLGEPMTDILLARMTLQTLALGST